MRYLIRAFDIANRDGEQFNQSFAMLRGHPRERNGTEGYVAGGSLYSVSHAAYLYISTSLSQHTNHSGDILSSLWDPVFCRLSVSDSICHAHDDSIRPDVTRGHVIKGQRCVDGVINPKNDWISRI
jgi:hypothetical protein